MQLFPGARYVQSPRWGFPRTGDPRTIQPAVLLVVHSTYILPTDTVLLNAMDETLAAISSTDREVSFTFCADRDGSVVQSLDPQTQAPWTNGLLREPNLTLAAMDMVARSSLNPNEHCFMTVENVANESLGLPITDSQIRTMGQLAAWASALSGIAISRETVLGHRDFDSVEKGACPTAGDLEVLIGRIVTASAA